MAASLQRLILTFKPGELVMHVLYGGTDPDGPRPNTKTRGREALDLTRAGLTEALKTLEREDGIECVGTSGFTRREDVFVALPHPDEGSEAQAAS
jgi:hypothetical protein